MKVLGQAFVTFLREHAATVNKPMFGYDLINPENGRELLVTRSGDVSRIAKQMGDPDWLDRQPA